MNRVVVRRACHTQHIGSKDRFLTIVAEAVLSQHAQSMSGFKKGDLTLQAVQALSGLRWVPDNLKVAKPQEQ